MDLCVVRSVGFKALYVFVILEHGRRKIRRIAVTGERFFGSLRRELLDHVIVWNASPLENLWAKYGDG